MLKNPWHATIESHLWNKRCSSINICRCDNILRLPVVNASPFVFFSFQAGRTAMHLACSAGHANVVASLLLSGADVNRPDGVSAQPLRHFLSLFIRSVLYCWYAWLLWWLRWGNHLSCILDMPLKDRVAQPHKEMQQQINYAFLNLIYIWWRGCLE